MFDERIYGYKCVPKSENRLKLLSDSSLLGLFVAYKYIYNISTIWSTRVNRFEKHRENEFFQIVYKNIT